MDKGGKGASRGSRRRGQSVVPPGAGNGGAAGEEAGHHKPPDRGEAAASDSGAGAIEQNLPERARNQEFFSRLSREEKQLLLLRNELYDGSWDEMETDLRHRLERKPYIFRLMNRIEDDLARISRLRAYEEDHHVDLGVFLGS